MTTKSCDTKQFCEEHTKHIEILVRVDENVKFLKKSLISVVVTVAFFITTGLTVWGIMSSSKSAEATPKVNIVQQK